ncbi:ADP-ribosylglycohydrolase [Aeromonas phage PX29]|uniref:ADP-ribosylglycohydrolase n=1 Tax=Aeromonas phage PX29 TaxID=926067 RepID=E5DQ64_9CAUD|nr:ADP-ribosylglycohydrolase [Aeromonas phage PX29]ADQ52850.1 conserved hypothetical protein [Aeromonas phage PX29]
MNYFAEQIRMTTQAAIIGDCVGSFNEFNFGTKGKKKLRKVTLELLQTKRDVWGHDYGYFTDDTTCALITMNCFKNGEFDIPQIMRQMRAWVEHGSFASNMECFDIGASTFNALYGKPICDAAKGAGNGALMRMYPVALATFGRDPASVERIVREMTEFTHPVEICVEYSLLYVKIMHRILAGVKKEQLENEFGHFFDQNECLPTGYVKDSLTIAWRTFLMFEHKEYGIYCIANMGLDSDTVASIYGSMIGAYSSISGNSQEFDSWLIDNIKRQDLIDSIVEKFSKNVVNSINNEQTKKVAPATA